MSIKYKLLSIDLDGTLLNHIKKISKKDLLALKKYNEAGGIIFINTGKSLKPTIKIINYLNKKIKSKIHYFSCLNGNIIYDLNTKKFLKESYIDNLSAQKIFQLIKDHKLWYSFYQKHNQNDVICRFNKYSSLNKIYKINILAKIRKIDNYKILVNDIQNLSDIELLKTSRYLFEIVKKNCNKGQALKYIVKLLNLPIETVATIGDSNNDLSMFKINNNSFLVKDRKNNELLNGTKYHLKLKKNKVAYVINNYVFQN